MTTTTTPKKAKKSPVKKTKAQKVSDALCLYIIDRSGSMGGMERAVAEGFNGFVAEQANLEGNCWISVVLFDDRIEIPVVGQDAKTTPTMVPFYMATQAEGPLPYYVRGSTALRDAVGTTILGGEEWLNTHPDFDGKVIVTIVTDGQENSSHQWTPSALRELIDSKKNAGWTFVYQGGSEAWTQAADLHIPVDTTFQYDTVSAAATTGTYTLNSTGVSNLRSFGAYSQT